ncbi:MULTISPECIES: flagellar protein FliT [unclassified Clostridioides]|uniref:flagellar protein FliT n=1 Tax=unclassified Clostridioides TaxID=2635829 RepID=UPI001D0C30E7|nr:flagellar protein FliT [Clostridioides sp. ES-S-0001-03]MCC0695954.1 flagellar protein FliT [Clostridioides sp. ES-S-0048-02]MCC0703788.1 flagellar protein FliT [Clostridioides sp. ES-S-0049-02]MCC0708789.1 flagellar protein FliT [Clostridioides sp. ES-S-0190-01]MCC0763618.1 flagellar protein FliT [Clostridioides sp. ES-S-0006-03]
MDKLEEKINLYKDISLQIITLIEKEEYKNISNRLNERQNIINSISEVDKNDFIQFYNDMELIEIDDRIRNSLQEQLSEVKKELHEYKLTKQVNTMYYSLNREKVNIFNKKV